MHATKEYFGQFIEDLFPAVKRVVPAGSEKIAFAQMRIKDATETADKEGWESF